MSGTTSKPQPRSVFDRLAENFIDLRGLPFSIKLFTVGGYLAVLFLLVVVLLFEVIGKDLPSVQYEYAEGVGTLTLPLAVMAFTILFLTLGWVYVVTGAAMSNARIFLPILGVFVLQLFTLTGGGSFAACAEAIFVFFFLIIYAITYRTGFWRNYPLVHFCLWLAVTVFFMFFSIGLAKTNADAANGITQSVTIIMLLTLTFWVFLGLDIINLGIEIGRSLTKLARRFLPFPALSAMTIFVLIVHPILVFMLVALTNGEVWVWGFDAFLSAAIALGSVVVGVMRRWNMTTAAVILSLSIASPVVSMGLSLAIQGSDFVELLLSLTGIFPPLLLFVGLTTYNVLNAGIDFTRVDGKMIPRGGRILLYFGFIILVITFMLFWSNERVTGTGGYFINVQSLINTLFSTGGLFLGIPYVLWLVWKRREEVIGDMGETVSVPRWLWLERFPVWVLPVIGLVAACLCSTVIIAWTSWYLMP